MVRREPGLCLYTEIAFQAFLEDCPDRFRPPPCMPDDYDPDWCRSAAGMMRRDHPVRLLSADAALICEDPTWAHDGGRLRRDNLLDLSGNFFRGCRYATTVCRYFLV